MSRKQRRGDTQAKGQSMVEFALVLPFLLLLFLGLVEVGLAMYDYIVVAGANREAVRLASRGRFTDQTIAARVVSAGGLHKTPDGGTEPNLRTTGPDSDTGIIITHVDIPIDGSEPIEVSYYVSGTITIDTPSGPQTRPVAPDDGHLSQMSADEILAYLDYRRNVSDDIDTYRADNDYEVMSTESFVIVETFYAHDLLIGTLPFIPNPLQLYFASTMRVLSDSRLD